MTLGRLTLLSLILALSACSKSEIPAGNKPVLHGWISVAGKSMLPTFPEASMVEIEIGVSFDELKVGDTVVYWDYKRGPGVFTHHRLIQKQGDAWIVKGDNPETNPVADQSWVTRDNFIARSTGKYALILIAQGAK